MTLYHAHVQQHTAHACCCAALPAGPRPKGVSVETVETALDQSLERTKWYSSLLSCDKLWLCGTWSGLNIFCNRIEIWSEHLLQHWHLLVLNKAPDDHKIWHCYYHCVLPQKNPFLFVCPVCLCLWMCVCVCAYVCCVHVCACLGKKARVTTRKYHVNTPILCVSFCAVSRVITPWNAVSRLNPPRGIVRYRVLWREWTHVKSRGAV